MRWLLMLFAAIPLAAGEIVLAELPLEDVPARSSVTIGTDGTDFLVAWIGQRRGEPAELFASRLTRDGVNLDPVGIPIDRDVANRPAAIAAGGDRWLIVHEREEGIRATLLGRDGVFVRSWTIHEEPATLDTAPRAAWNGREFLITWEDRRPSGSRGVFVSADGDTIAGPFRFGDTVVGLTVRRGVFVAATLNRGQGCSPGPCWFSYRLVTIDARDAAPVELSTFLFPARYSPAGLFALETDGDGFLFAAGNPGGTTVRVVGLDGAGVPRGETVLIPRLFADMLARIAVAWTGAEYLVIAPTFGEMRAARVTRDGQPVEVGETFPPGHGYLAVAGDRIAAAFSRPADRSDGTHSVHAEVRTLAGTPVGGERTLSRKMDVRPRVAANGEDVLAVWEGGGVLLRRAIPLVALGGSFASPDVAFDGQRYLLVDAPRGGGVHARLLDADGATITELALPLFGQREETPRVAAAPDGGFVVVWRSTFRDGHTRIAAALVSREGVVLTPRPLDVMPGGIALAEPDVAAMGGDFLVTAASVIGISVTRLSRSGAVLDGTVIRERGRSPAVAAGAGDAVISWTDDALRAHAVRLDSRLNVAGRFSFGTRVSSPATDVVRSGDGYTVFFADRNLTAQRLGGTPRRLAPSMAEELSPSVVASPPGFIAVFLRVFDGAAEVVLRDWFTRAR